jgi:hypothetical protein
LISLEQVKANPRGLSPRPSKASVAVEQDKRIVLRNLGEFLDVLSRCHPESHFARLAGTKDFSRTAQAQIFLGDAEAITGLSHQA